jgi:hypothetical protein
MNCLSSEELLKNVESAGRRLMNCNWKCAGTEGSHSAASLAPLLRGWRAFASTGPKNFPV